MAKLAIWFILLYQKWVSPRLPYGVCEMNPSCSQYGLQSFQRFGFFKGMSLTTRRLFRCGNPTDRHRSFRNKVVVCFWTLDWILNCIVRGRQHQTTKAVKKLTNDPVPKFYERR
jgi:putative component of membrane protein insertase Oxa1/YidC/SpoIIIJ protein YidD